MSIRSTAAMGAALALTLGLPAPGAAQNASGTARVHRGAISDARLQGYRMSGIGLPTEGDWRLPVARPRVRPFSLGRVRSGADTLGRAPPPAPDSTAAGRPPPSPGVGRSVVIVAGPGHGRHAVEVIRAGRRTPAVPDSVRCVRVEIRLRAGTVRRARVALSRLGADGPREARRALRRRMEERGVLTLRALDGTGLTVPARLVRGVAVEPCRRRDE